MRKWLRIDQEKPEQKQLVYYWFGFFDEVYAGKYKECDEMDCFFDKGGFLCGDITYWMPREEGDKMPEPPSAKEKETCLYHPLKQGWCQFKLLEIQGEEAKRGNK